MAEHSEYATSPAISVCVPTYNRASMLRDVITSFWAQQFHSSELVLLDDASPDDTQRVAEAAASLDPRIVYRRNPTTAGYCENFRRCLIHARGQYIVMLGDDDILLGPDALAAYVDVFARNPDVFYAYPNQIQMDATMHFDLAYRHFETGTRFDAGSPSFTNTWLKSILITGMAMRQSVELFRHYPSATMLFPQVELVGRLLCDHESYGIADYLVAARAHTDQLGFHANRRQRIVGPEKHGTLEILDIVAKLDVDCTRAPHADVTARTLARALATNLPNERLRGSRQIAIKSARQLMRRSSAARRSTSLLASLVVTACVPAPVLRWLRSWAKAYVRSRNLREAQLFDAELHRQRICTAEQRHRLDEVIRFA